MPEAHGCGMQHGPLGEANPVGRNETGGGIGRELGFQRYDQIVTALGGHGEVVEKPEETLERAFASGKPALVNVCTDPEPPSQTDVGFAGY